MWSMCAWVSRMYLTSNPVLDGVDEFVGLVARVDDRSFARAFTADDVAVLVEWWHRADFEDHGATILLLYRSGENMILCVLDDLIFSIKISTAAKLLGAPIYFERSKENVLSVRAKQPSLVIFDLNSAKLAPIEMIAAMKEEPALSVDPHARLRLPRRLRQTIIRARSAGIDQVLARSAFSEKLGDILTSA